MASKHLLGLWEERQSVFDLLTLDQVLEKLEMKTLSLACNEQIISSFTAIIVQLSSLFSSSQIFVRSVILKELSLTVLHT